TLSDHPHELRSAIQAVCAKYTLLQAHTEDYLVATYNQCLESTYDQYLMREITYEEKDIKKIRLFFSELGMLSPSLDEVEHFKQEYKEAYRANRRATPSSIKTLYRLKRRGFRTAIIANRQNKDQYEKADKIGLLSLVDVLLTSEDVEAVKPDARMFRVALEVLDADVGNSFMVGDDLDADI
ncbi:HAD-like protein, partial [Acephala macrosclerotiorum]